MTDKGKSIFFIKQITEKLRYKASPFMEKKAVVCGVVRRMGWMGYLIISNQPREEKKFLLSNPLLYKQR
ncbi:hypothetical protein [Dapis sp. BLCC M172]|uniref:hypothetical protein n=1 Tax=Dapis sp. BLCC M172 TaxID=2975281 RepID=UPI003CF02BE3